MFLEDIKQGGSLYLFLVGLFAMTEGVENNFVSENVIAQTVVAPTNAPLAFAGSQASEFLDILAAASVMRVVRENCD